MSHFLFKRVLRIFLSGLLLLLPLNYAGARDILNMLCFSNDTEGINNFFYLAQSPEWLPGEDVHIVKYCGSQYEIPNTEGVRVYLAIGQWSGIGIEHGGMLNVVFDDQRMIIRNIDKPVDVSVYTVSGKIVLKETAEISDERVIDLSILAGGIYMVSVERQTFKYIKR